MPRIGRMMVTDRSPWRGLLGTVLTLAGVLGLHAVRAEGTAAPVSSAAPVEYAQARTDLTPVLPADAETLSRAARYRTGIIAEMTRAPDAPTLCFLVHEANALGPLIASKFSAFQQRLLGQGRATKALDALTARVSRATHLLPGIGLAVGAESVSSFVDYRALAQLAPQGSASHRLLTQMSHLWRPPNGWPVFMEQQTDASGCTRPEALTGSVQQIGNDSPGAPACLRKELEAQLDEAVTTIAYSACFCADKFSVTEGLRGLEAALNADGMHAEASTIASAIARLPSGQARFMCVAN